MRRGRRAGRASGSLSHCPVLSFKISIQLKEVTCLKKEKTAKLIPNAIQICTESEKVNDGQMGAARNQDQSGDHSHPSLPRHTHQSRSPFVLNLACLLSRPSQWSIPTHFG